MMQSVLVSGVGEGTSRTSTKVPVVGTLNFPKEKKRKDGKKKGKNGKKGGKEEKSEGKKKKKAGKGKLSAHQLYLLKNYSYYKFV